MYRIEEKNTRAKYQAFITTVGYAADSHIIGSIQIVHFKIHFEEYNLNGTTNSLRLTFTVTYKCKCSSECYQLLWESY